jgi:hypothetical protein
MLSVDDSREKFFLVCEVPSCRVIVSSVDDSREKFFLVSDDGSNVVTNVSSVDDRWC